MSTQLNAVDSFIEQLQNKGDKKFSIQIAPAVRVAIGEYLGYPPGQNLVGQLIGALRSIGIDYVFDTNFGADLTVVEEAFELVERIRKHKLLPMFTTCCPSWYMFIEKMYPEIIPYLSTVKSPQAILASVVKTYFRDSIKLNKDNFKHFVLAPCAMKKEEAKKKELWVYEDEPNIDMVLTTKEMVEVFNKLKVDFKNVDKSDFDNPLGLSSGAGAIFGTTGGVMEAALRTAYYYYTGEDMKDFNLYDVRNTGLVKEGLVDFHDIKLNICTFNSLQEVKPVLEEIKKTGKCKYHFIEVMNCPLGCIGGVGQWTDDKNTLLQRRRAIFEYDQEHKFKAAHQNKFVKELYDKFLGNVGGERAHELMHTHYKDKTTENSDEFKCKVN